jgi:hypothetical protein
MTEVQELQQRGRTMNIIQEFLVHKLLFPKVYLDADWNGNNVDVLAIDRSGSGDVHAVQIYPLPPNTTIGAACILFSSANRLGLSFIDEIMSLQSHYRYIAIASEDPNARKFNSAELASQWALAEDGVGRIGILYLDLTEDDPKFQVRIILRAERFRSSKELVEVADRFVADHTANWEFREEL